MIEHLLNRTVTVWREERTETGSGGWIVDWVPKGPRRARRSQPSASERVVAEQAGAALDTRYYFADGADVHRGDRLHDGSDVYRVAAVIVPSEPGVYRRADCEHIQTEGGRPDG